jgi:hypothetical protein
MIYLLFPPHSESQLSEGILFSNPRVGYYPAAPTHPETTDVKVGKQQRRGWLLMVGGGGGLLVTSKEKRSLGMDLWDREYERVSISSDVCRWMTSNTEEERGKYER